MTENGSKWPLNNRNDSYICIDVQNHFGKMIVLISENDRFLNNTKEFNP